MLQQMTRIIALLLLLFSFSVYGQKRNFKAKPFYKHRYKNIIIPRSKEKIICPGEQRPLYPYQSIGVKFGDPTGLTYKLHISKHFSFVMDYGRAASGLYNRYHRENFSQYANYDTLSTGNTIAYFGHTVKKDGVFAMKILYNRPFMPVKQLQWFVGAGFHYRWMSVDYTFLYKPLLENGSIQGFSITQFNLGPVLSTGIEYSSPYLPISSFIEFELYYGMQDNPGWIRSLAGIGVRYSF